MSNTAQQQQHTAQILPTERVQALNTLIKATQSLINLADREAQALAQNDMVGFHIMQDEKQYLTQRYERLSVEFRARIEEFRGSDRGLLDRLEKLQILLGERTKNNSDVVVNIRDRAQQKTQNSLLTVQELAQQKSVRFGAHTGQV